MDSLTKSSGFNDKARLADARSLARSFSKAKPTKAKTTKADKQAGPFYQGHKPGSSYRHQAKTSIIRPGALSSVATMSRQPRRLKLDLPELENWTGLEFVNRADTTVEGSTSDKAAQSPPAAAALSSLHMDRVHDVMSQIEQEDAQVDPLIEKLRDWNLQSPIISKVSSVQQPPPLKLFANMAEPTSVSAPKNDSSDKSSEAPLSVFKHEEVNTMFTSAARPTKIATQATAQQQGETKTAVKTETVDLISFPTSECICNPVIKPQRGLASSRFASKDTALSSFADRFPFKMEITIHQDFCPLSNKENKKPNERNKNAETPLRKLRPEAGEFIPLLITEPEIY